MKVTSSRSRRSRTDGSRDLLVLPHRGRVGHVLPARGVRLRGRACCFRSSRARTRSAVTLLRTIGPVWDGNEVWLVVAGGATFAAFPAWYATMFSGFYLALLLILVFLIVRVVSFEWRAKSETPGWRATWTWANTIGSFGASLLWGIGLSCLALRRPDRLGRRLHRRPPGSLQSVQRVRRRRGRRAVRVPRGDVPHAPHDGRAARPRRGRRATACDPRRGARAPRTSSGRSRSRWTATTRISSHRHSRRPLGIVALALAVVFVFTAELRARVRDDRARRDLARRHALREPVSRASWSRAPTSRTA